MNVDSEGKKADAVFNDNGTHWSAHIFFDNGKIGGCGVHGLKSRDEAIAWLADAFDVNRHWFMLPSMRIARHPKGNENDL